MESSPASIKSERMEWPHCRQQLVFSIDWMLKTLGFVAAVLFGIWAPLSYKASLDGNRSNDASQVQLLNSIGELNRRLEEQQKLLEQQIRKTNMVNGQLHLMTRLSLLDFCALGDHSTMSPCSTFLGTDRLNDLASEVLKAGQTTSTSVTTSTATSTRLESSVVTSKSSVTSADSLSSTLSTRSASTSAFPTSTAVEPHEDVPTFGESHKTPSAFFLASILIGAVLLITTLGTLTWRWMRKSSKVELEKRDFISLDSDFGCSLGLFPDSKTCTVKA